MIITRGTRSFYSYDHSPSDAASINIIYEYPPQISGYVRDASGTGIGNVTITANNNGESTTTNSSGYYKVRVPSGWSGSVRPYREFWTFDSGQRTYQGLYSDRTEQNFMGTAPVSVSGYVKDSNETPVHGVSISTDNSGGTATTDVNGYYELLVPYGWSGSISSAKRLWFFEPNHIERINVTDTLTNQNFEGTSGFIASGHVYTKSGTALEGANMEADNGARGGTTNSAGYYEVTFLAGWSGTITPIKQGRYFTPVSKSYNNLVADFAEQDFIASDLIDVIVGSGQFATIQAAIDPALTGDTIVIHPGKYAGFTVNKPSLTIRSVEPENPAIVAATIIESRRLPFPTSEQYSTDCHLFMSRPQ